MWAALWRYLFPDEDQDAIEALIMKVVPEAYVAETFEQAVAMSRQTSAPVATLEGDVLRGPHVVSGGAKAESRGILATKREIKELQGRTAEARDALARLTEDNARLEVSKAEATSARPRWRR